MFDHDKMRRIIAECTLPMRKGPVIREEVIGPLMVFTVDDMPSSNDVMETAAAMDKSLTTIDCHFMEVAVDMDKAQFNRTAFVEQLDQWPGDFCTLDNGPSYIALGAVLGDQGRAFQMMALGEALGLWEVITPAKLGLTGERAEQAAGAGYIMMTGYAP